MRLSLSRQLSPKRSLPMSDRAAPTHRRQPCWTSTAGSRVSRRPTMVRLATSASWPTSSVSSRRQAVRAPSTAGATGASTILWAWFQPLRWEEAEGWLSSHLNELHGRRQAIVWLTPHLTGALDQLIDRWLQAFGSKRRLRYEPFAYEAIKAANKLLFGLEAIPTYNLQSSQLILSFGSDFLETWISPVMYARQFAAMRACEDGRMGRFIFIGPRRSMTAVNADRWIPVPSGSEGVVALGMVRVILAEDLWRGVPKREVERIRSLVDRYTTSVVSQIARITPADLEALARSFAKADQIGRA